MGGSDGYDDDDNNSDDNDVGGDGMEEWHGDSGVVSVVDI